MPNHVTTIIKPVCTTDQFYQILSSILNIDGYVDFNNIIKIDDEFSGFNPHLDIIDRAKKAIGVKENFITDLPLIDKNKIDDLIKAIYLYKKTGFFYWYEAQLKLWGTKWNAYNQEISPDYIKFDTAWRTPSQVLYELSSKYPDIEFNIQYADEDLGFNCGEFTIKNGVLIKENIAIGKLSDKERKKWVSFAFNLIYPNGNPAEHGFDKDFNYIDE